MQTPQLQDALASLSGGIAAAVGRMPPLGDFIARYCASPA
jgi:hypothetical protein